MTIKEIEARSGLDRATIRYYEREGFINVQRLPNGYRDYSEEDLDILLRIKLLRQIGLSMDDLKLVISGQSSLADILIEIQATLKQEVEQQVRAAWLCQTLLSAQTDFDKLDAPYYLERSKPLRLPSTPTTVVTSNSHQARSSADDALTIWDRLPYVYRPLRRLAARYFDFFLYNNLLIALIRLTLGYDPFVTQSYLVVVNLLAILISLILEPFLLHFFKTTPGKALFLLRIEAADGRPLSLEDARTRTWQLIQFGFGFFIPIYQLVCMYRQLDTLMSSERCEWDRFIAYRFIEKGRIRDKAWIPTVLVILGLGFAIMNWSHLPPKRGDLDVHRFVENHHFYERLLKIEFMRHLDLNGAWVEVDQGNVIIIDLFDSPSIQYEYDLRDGVLAAVSFSVEVENDSERWISSFDSYTTLSMLAILGADREVWLASRLMRELLAEIPESPFENFDFELNGYRIRQDCSKKGYVDGSSILFPDDSAKQHHFRFDFSIEKIG